MQKDSKKQIDWTITLVPLGIVVALSAVSYTHLTLPTILRV